MYMCYIHMQREVPAIGLIRQTITNDKTTKKETQKQQKIKLAKIKLINLQQQQQQEE